MQQAPHWWLTTDQDVALLAMHARHYPKRHYADGRRVYQCMGPGEKVPLRTEVCDAIWGWRKFIDDCIDIRTNERQEGRQLRVLSERRPCQKLGPRSSGGRDC